ncbi:hypothetical protein [Erythrobacter sp. AP23]|uniref:hypothetical protein n=1 Tax=Erythrobacter sp. AP23 TaxID=499656 RepID=UPI00076BCA20|nr:hypothetical protein [Erythrobacter sp. AP23]KWV96194.1 hypothetical protein ASS64_03000 [Erythrobacter sp. AP23]
MSNDPKSPSTLPSFTPVPRKKDRSNGWKPHVQRAFIEALADTGSVAAACRMVRRSTVGAYHLRRQPGAEEFAAAWEAALDLGMRRIEDTAMDRALNGVEVPVYSYGKLVGTRTVHNDRLLMFMLRNRAPERFAEGRPKALNAVGRMEEERLKKKWRAEWEAEQRRVSPSEVRASIERKVEAFRRQQEMTLSPRTLAARAEFERLRDEDAARGYRPVRTPSTRCMSTASTPPANPTRCPYPRPIGLSARRRRSRRPRRTRADARSRMRGGSETPRLAQAIAPVIAKRRVAA